MHTNLLPNTKLSIAISVTNGAAASTDVAGAGLDMADFEGVRAIVQVGAVVTNAVTTVKWQQSDDDGSSDAYSDLEGTSITIADSDDEKVVNMELFRPRKRYVRIYVDRATQNATVTAVYEQYGCRIAPLTSVQGTGIIGNELHVSPDEGTA